MASRTPHTGVALEVFTAANLAKYPKGVFGYVYSETDSTGITSETDLTGLSVSVTVGESRLIVVEAFVPRVSSDTADDVGILRINESSTCLAEARVYTGAVSTPANDGSFGYVKTRPFSPSAGSHTYKAAGALALGTGDLAFRCGAVTQGIEGWIQVTDVGPSF